VKRKKERNRERKRKKNEEHTEKKKRSEKTEEQTIIKFGIFFSKRRFIMFPSFHFVICMHFKPTAGRPITTARSGIWAVSKTAGVAVA
jgi:hypothetical protein